jgi:hypothetical protein
MWSTLTSRTRGGNEEEGSRSIPLIASRSPSSAKGANRFGNGSLLPRLREPIVAEILGKT